MRRAAPIALAVLLGALAGPAGPAALGAVPAGGLFGRVVKACPPAQVRTCTATPLRLVLVFARVGRAYRPYRFSSGRDGAYRAPLPAGTYAVRVFPRVGIQLRRVHPATVTVRAARFARVDFQVTSELP